MTIAISSEDSESSKFLAVRSVATLALRRLRDDRSRVFSTAASNRFFYPRDAVQARILAMIMCLCPSVSVCLSQVGVLSKAVNGLI